MHVQAATSPVSLYKQWCCITVTYLNGGRRLGEKRLEYFFVEFGDVIASKVDGGSIEITWNDG